MSSVLVFAGSARRDSFNKKLARAATTAANAAGLSATFVDLADYEMPLYNGDLETAEGVPASVQLLADQIASADAVIIATPEYNKALSGSLKNALDWVSRTKGGPWKDKPVAIMSAAAGRAGGERSQFSLRLAMMRSSIVCKDA